MALSKSDESLECTCRMARYVDSPHVAKPQLDVPPVCMSPDCPFGKANRALAEQEAADVFSPRDPS